jgi:hypothetical protein
MDLLFYLVLSAALTVGIIALLKWVQAEDARGRIRNQFKDIVSDLDDDDD